MSRSTIDPGSRRDFLTGAGATVVASTLGFTPRASAAQSAPPVGSGPSDVAVIGAGAFGALHRQDPDTVEKRLRTRFIVRR